MSKIILKKNGTDYIFGLIPIHYPADRVYLDGDTDKNVQDAIDEVNDNKVSKTGDTMSGNLQVDRQDGTVSEYGKSYLIAGNNIAEGTANNSRGILRLYDTETNFANVIADALTANRTITLPDKNGTVALTDDTDDKVSKSTTGAQTMVGNLVIDRANGTTESTGSSAIQVGNNTPSGTAGNSRGYVELFGTTAYYARLRAGALTANRNIDLPDKAGTVALTSDIKENVTPKLISEAGGN